MHIRHAVKSDLIKAVFAVVIVAGMTHFGTANAYELDGNTRTVAGGVVSQAVAPTNEIGNTLTDAKDQACVDRTSDGCKIGSAAIDGASLRMEASNFRATLAFLLATFAIIVGIFKSRG